MNKFLAVIVVIVMLFTVTAIASEVEPVSASNADIGFRVDLTEIIVSVIGIIFSFLAMWLMKAVVPSAKMWLETKTTAKQREMLNTLTRQLVLAAEQTIGTGNGSKKLQYVCDGLRKRGFTVDLDAIESCVHDMNMTLLSQFIDGKTDDLDEQESE